MIRMTGPVCAVMCNLINIHTYIDTCIHTSIHDRAGLRGYVQLINIHTYIHKYIESSIPHWESQCEWHKNDSDDGAGLRGYLRLINIHTYIHTYIPLCRV